MASLPERASCQPGEIPHTFILKQHHIRNILLNGFLTIEEGRRLEIIKSRATPDVRINTMLSSPVAGEIIISGLQILVSIKCHFNVGGIPL